MPRSRPESVITGTRPTVVTRIVSSSPTVVSGPTDATCVRMMPRTFCAALPFFSARMTSLSLSVPRRSSLPSTTGKDLSPDAFMVPWASATVALALMVTTSLVMMTWAVSSGGTMSRASAAHASSAASAWASVVSTAWNTSFSNPSASAARKGDGAAAASAGRSPRNAGPASAGARATQSLSSFVLSLDFFDAKQSSSAAA
mmetsp:Transcript_23525/g.77410  ORF Transcript_23525/g.77410 Transcript_23525/m.77410 type:complete len:201 (-) Transcript_23525:246-848(-)